MALHRNWLSDDIVMLQYAILWIAPHTHCFILDCFALLSTALHCCISLHDDPPQFCTRLDCELHWNCTDWEETVATSVSTLFLPPALPLPCFHTTPLLPPFQPVFDLFIPFLSLFFPHCLCRFLANKKSTLPHSDGWTKDKSGNCNWLKCYCIQEIHFWGWLSSYHIFFPS